MADNAAKNPKKIFEVKQAIAEGDRVVVHSHVRMRASERGVAVVHIFRFEADRIAELWDLGMPIPEASPNENGMFSSATSQVGFEKGEAARRGSSASGWHQRLIPIS